MSLEDEAKKAKEELGKILITNDEMDEIVVAVDEIARNFVSHRDGFPPLFFLVLDRGAVARMSKEDQDALDGLPEGYDGSDNFPRPIIVTIMEPHLNWHADIFNMGRSVKYPVVAAFFISEAWHSSQKADQKYMRPSEDPNRKEVIMLTGASIDNRSRVRMYELEREGGAPEKGKMIWGKMLNEELPDNLENNVLGAFWRGYARGFFERFIAKSLEENPDLINEVKQKLTQEE